MGDDAPQAGRLNHSDPARGFLARARFEADRYGSDPWVFVRELLQNARDAGAKEVVFTVHEEARSARLTCRDDGCGMSLEHAERYLFTLYASSKRPQRGDAGRYGVGFWSILRFTPRRIVVRSWTHGCRPWEVELAGDLSRAQQNAAPARPGTGTEIVLERAPSDGQLARRVADAAAQSGRFLRQRGSARPLVIRVDGRRVDAPFELQPPSVSFERRGSRGIVALSMTPGVELFSKGLRVRAATYLDDLLAGDGRATRDTRVRFAHLPGGVAPQCLLESDKLEELLARSDVREGRELHRLVERAQRELMRLIERQMDALSPRSLPQRLLGSAWPQRLGLLLALLLLAGAGAVALSRHVAVAPGAWVVAPNPAPEVRPTLRPYRDLADLYAGPTTERLGSAVPGIALSYQPASESPYFAALITDSENPEAHRRATADASALPSYEGVRPAVGGLEIELDAELVRGRALRLPLPTGQRLVVDTLRGPERDVRSTPWDEPVLIARETARRVLRYRTAPAAPRPSGFRPPQGGAPEALSSVLAQLGALPVAARPDAARTWVQAHVRYASDSVPDLAPRGESFVARTLGAGAGDCDVMNGLLAVLLSRAGVPARLAVGYVGRDGRALGTHAWVEERIDQGPWRVLDATLPVEVHRPPVPSLAATHGVQARALAPAASSTHRPRVGSIVLSAGLLCGGTLAAGFLAFSRRRRSVVRTDRACDLARLLRGALEQPESFAAAPAVFERPLIETIDGRRLALGEAWEEAHQGRLYLARSKSSLARKASRIGAWVVRTDREEGRVAAETLGGISLDEWGARLEASREHPALRGVKRWLGQLRDTWDVRLGPPGAESAVLTLSPARPGRLMRRRAWHLVVLGGESWVGVALKAHAREPQAALFTLVDGILELVDLSPEERAATLDPLARKALRAWTV